MLTLEPAPNSSLGSFLCGFALSFLAAYSRRTLAKIEPGLSERMEISKETVLAWAAELTKYSA